MSTFDPRRHPRRPDGKFASAPPPACPDPDLASDLAGAPSGGTTDNEPVIDPALAERLCAKLVEPPARFLVSTGNDRLFVEVAAPVDGVGSGCLDCDTQTNGPSFDAVDERTGDIWGAYGDQCGGCGGLGAGWVHSGAVEVDVIDPDDFEAVVGDLLNTVSTEAARRRAAAASTVADAMSRVADALSDGDIETVADLARAFPPDPDGDGGVYYDPYDGEFGCWLPGFAAEDGLDTCWATKIRSDADLADALTRLAADPDRRVRWAAARTPATPPGTLTALAADPDEDVRTAAAANPNTPAAGRAAGGLLAD